MLMRLLVTWLLCIAQLPEGGYPQKLEARADDADVLKFTGNTTHSDHFKLLERDGDSLLVGARNIVYNISLTTLQENKRLEWYPLDEDVRMCTLKGKSDEACHNYVRVLAKTSDNGLYVCGTNAFKPKCRRYEQTAEDYAMIDEKSGEGICPYDPDHNSTAVFAGPIKSNSDENLYVATAAQFTGTDPLIYRSPLRTIQYNPKHLNAPNFVHSLHKDEHVYFFFRETATEYINCGKAVYSRVARVCTKDRGGPHQFQEHWTSYVKARLNCSIPGDFPFYLDEIQSTTGIVKGLYNGEEEELIYGVFTTPLNSVGGSAVCAFRMADIYKAFDGQFKGQIYGSNSIWMPVPSSKVPNPRPGRCTNDSELLPESTLNFLKEHPLMDEAVPAHWGRPTIIQTSLNFRYTQIAVDPQLETVSGKKFDVLFIATSDGRVLKAVNAGSAAPKGHHYHNQVVPVIVEEVIVFPKWVPITNLLLYHTYYQNKLLVVSKDEIKAIPLHKCKRRKSCGDCVSLQDPYCAWDISRQICTNSRTRFWNRDNFIQNVEDGWDPRCPDGRPPVSSRNIPAQTEQHTRATNTITIMGEEESREPGVGEHPSPTAELYKAETLAFAVVTSVVSALVVGFILGYIFSRRCRKEDPDVCGGAPSYVDPTAYMDHHHHHHLQETYGGVGHPAPNNKPINLVLNVPPKNGKNANSSADNKPIQKVKKIYL